MLHRLAQLQHSRNAVTHLLRTVATRHAPYSQSSAHRPLTVLGIETSCDDTACAIVDTTGSILGESKLSHLELVKQWGGVNPSYMARAHEQAVEDQVWGALQNWGSTVDATGESCQKQQRHQEHQVDRAAIERLMREEVDAVAVTCGPGLAPCLRAGTSFARQLAREFDKPLLPIHHLEAHLLTFRLIDQQLTQSVTPFPFLVLLVSGGHCMLVLARAYRQYEILGETMDDSVGEAFDKVARMLGLNLEYGGGVELEKHAKFFRDLHLPKRHAQQEDVIAFPLSAKLHQTLDFSFSGLKTAVLRKTRELEWIARNNENDASSQTQAGSGQAVLTSPTGGDINRMVRERNAKHPTFLPLETTAELAYAFQEAALYQLIRKTMMAIRMLKGSDCEELRAVNTLVVAGGVASNELLRSKLHVLCDSEGFQVKYPAIRLCTDNGAMIAWAGVEHINHCGGLDKATDLLRDPNLLDVRLRWTLDMLKH